MAVLDKIKSFFKRPKPEALTVKEAADSLKVSRFTVYRWIKKGRLKAIRSDGIYRIEEAALNELLGKSRNEGGGEMR